MKSAALSLLGLLAQTAAFQTQIGNSLPSSSPTSSSSLCATASTTGVKRNANFAKLAGGEIMLLSLAVDLCVLRNGSMCAFDGGKQNPAQVHQRVFSSHRFLPLRSSRRRISLPRDRPSPHRLLGEESRRQGENTGQFYPVILHDVVPSAVADHL